VPIEGLNEMCCLTCMCSCNEGYGGAYCSQVAATSTSELPLLVSLSTLLPIAAILVVIVSIIFIYRRMRPDVSSGGTRRHRNNVRARYQYRHVVTSRPVASLLISAARFPQICDFFQGSKLELAVTV